MNWDSIKPWIAKAAPLLGTAVGGPFGTMAGALVAQALGTKDASPEAIDAAIKNGNITPDQMVALKLAEENFSLEMAKLNISSKEQLAELEFKTEAAYLSDTQDARAHKDTGTFYMAICILVTFVVLMAAVLIGCFRILNGGIPIKDASVVAVVFTLVGTIVGYVASNAQTVVNFEFGSSRGGSIRADKMADAVSSIANQQK